jgi:putative ABC transport system permease protein
MLNDLRFAIRLLVKQPGFTLAAILALGCGIGLSTAIFNAFSAVLLRPVPHLREENRIVYINPFILKQPDSQMGMTLPDFLDLRDRTQTLDGLTLVMDRTFIFGGGEKPERVLGASISAASFTMLGVQPLRGRVFRPDEEKDGAAPVAILSYGLWQRRFGGSDAIIGRTTQINGDQVTVIGVLPEGFRFPEVAELWMPMRYDVKNQPRGNFSFPCYARMKPGVTLDQVQAELTTVAADFARQYKDTNDGVSLRARLIRDEATRESGTQVRLMLGAAVFVLLIACANVANLLLAKSAARSREIAIRTALGATRGRIVRQVLTESLLLGLAGGALGLLVGVWVNGLILGAIPVELPFWMKFGFDWLVFAFSLAAAIGSSLLFGLFPALQISRSTATEMKDGARGSGHGPRAQRLRNALVVAQVALALVLLIGAGLMVRSFLKLQSADYGVVPRGVLTFRVGLPPTQFKDQVANRRFFTQLLERLSTMPGVEAVGATTMIPGSGMNINAFAIAGRERPKSLLESPYAVNRSILPGYFRALGIPLLSGRDFTLDDVIGKPKVVIVDQSFVEKWFPGQDPIGQRINNGEYDKADDWLTIIGVVGTVPQRLGGNAPTFGFYAPALQDDLNFITFTLRTKGDPASFAQPAQQVVLSLQKDIPIYNVQTLEKSLANAYWDKKFFSQIFGAFGIGALFLASLGIYGVMAYSVTQRTQEIGVRMALGAQPADVLRMVNRHGMTLVAVGMGVGLVSALGLTRLMGGLLYGVSPSDPPTYFSLSTVLAIVGVVACWLPARRATRVDPVVALRAE